MPKFTFDDFWNFTYPLESGDGQYGGTYVPVLNMFPSWDQNSTVTVCTGMGVTFTHGASETDSLSWYYKDGNPQQGYPCSPDDVHKEYAVVLGKGQTDPPIQGGVWQSYQDVTQCRTTTESIKQWVEAKMNNIISDMKSRYFIYLFDFDNYPADAQLGLVSLGYALGTAETGLGKWRKLLEACRDQRWVGRELPPQAYVASKQCAFGHPVFTQVQRSQWQVQCFTNAGAAIAGAGDPNTLQFPNALPDPTTIWHPPESDLVGDWAVTIGDRSGLTFTFGSSNSGQQASWTDSTDPGNSHGGLWTWDGHWVHWFFFDDPPTWRRDFRALPPLQNVVQGSFVVPGKPGTTGYYQMQKT
jgi:hypothetical protein